MAPTPPFKPGTASGDQPGEVLVVPARPICRYLGEAVLDQEREPEKLTMDAMSAEDFNAVELAATVARAKWHDMRDTDVEVRLPQHPGAARVFWGALAEEEFAKLTMPEPPVGMGAEFPDIWVVTSRVMQSQRQADALVELLVSTVKGAEQARALLLSLPVIATTMEDVIEFGDSSVGAAFCLMVRRGRVEIGGVAYESRAALGRRGHPLAQALREGLATFGSEILYRGARPEIKLAYGTNWVDWAGGEQWTPSAGEDAFVTGFAFNIMIPAYELPSL